MRSCLTGHVAQFLRSEEGPTTVEYAVLLAPIIVVCVGAVQGVGNNASAKFRSVSNTLAS
jgi:pilus assembly protein Flp/PilA